MNVEKLICHKMCEALRLPSRAGAHFLGANKFLPKQVGNLQTGKNNFGTKCEDVGTHQAQRTKRRRFGWIYERFQGFDMCLRALLG